MPWGDRTGPWGAGPMTGRGLGYCAGYPAPGYPNPVGYGFGRGGRGRGRGFRRWSWAAGLPGGVRGGGVPFAPWAAGYPAAYPPYPTAYPYVTPTLNTPEARKAQKEVLAQQAKDVEEELAGIKKQLAELEKEG